MERAYSEALPYIRSISPYQPGKPITELAREFGLAVGSIVKLASNENPLGMSPKARGAMLAEIDGLARYPDDYELKKAVAEHHELGTERIVLGNGSNDLLELIARVYLASGRSAVFSRHAFAVYALATQATGAECIEGAAHEFGHDLDAMLAAVRPDTRVVWIANPNNPTGTFLPYADLKSALRRLPEQVIVVLDEAYNAYIPPAEQADTVQWLREFPNLVITRTFSKVYGMAGLRIGYALTSAAIADLMNRVRQPFNCNNLALAAAIAALDDQAFVERSVALNAQEMTRLCTAFGRLGLDSIPSRGNFITVRVPEAAAVNLALLKQGVIVRPLAGYGMPDHLRVTIGLAEENSRFLAALEAALRGR